MSTITEDGRTLLTFDEAAALLPDGEQIHTFLDSPIALIGADWSRDSILDLLRTGNPQLAGPSAAKSGHGLTAYDVDHWVFIATKPTIAKADA